MSDKMTEKWVASQVACIREVADDDEVAHGLEDELYERILRAIAADNIVDPQACALAALRTKDVNFARWCA